MKCLNVYDRNLTLNQTRTLKDVYGAYTYFEDNDVLLAKITPCFENGKVGIARNLKNGIGFGSSEFIVFRSEGKVIPEYLYYYLSQESFRQEGKAMMAGAVGHKRVSKEFINEYQLPFPESIQEQKRIVAILDEVCTAVDKAKANVEKNLANSKELFESYLNVIFANPGEDWEKYELNKHVKFIDYRGRTPKKTKSGIRLITAKNIKKGYIQREPEEYIAIDNYDSWMTRGLPEKGDILFTTEAPLANVAQLDTSEKVAFAQRTIIFQPDSKVLNKKFLKYLLLSKPIQDKIFAEGTGATVKGIKSRLLKKIKITFPGLQEQLSIVVHLDKLSNETKQIESIYQEKIDALDELKKSALKKAFEGELWKK
jgi:type I restriction enzyme S subunit